MTEIQDKYAEYINKDSTFTGLDIMERESFDENEGRLFFIRYNREYRLVESYSLYGKSDDEVEVIHKGIRFRKSGYDWYVYTESGELLNLKYMSIKEPFKNTYSPSKTSYSYNSYYDEEERLYEEMQRHEDEQRREYEELHRDDDIDDLKQQNDINSILIPDGLNDFDDIDSQVSVNKDSDDFEPDDLEPDDFEY